MNEKITGILSVLEQGGAVILGSSNFIRLNGNKNSKYINILSSDGDGYYTDEGLWDLSESGLKNALNDAMDIIERMRDENDPDGNEDFYNVYDKNVQEIESLIKSRQTAVQEESTASPTSGMNLRERILHVGGWETERGTVEFGSMMAVDALVSHILRDIAVYRQPATRKLGITGAAFDPPSVRRAYTYSDQPNNTTAWKLGRAACKERSGGDLIDYGLQMLRYLQDEGFGVFEIDEADPAPPQPAEQVERWRHDAEDLEALHNNLDDAGTPRHHSSGAEYSAWGRVIQYAKAASPHPAEQKPTPDESLWEQGFIRGWNACLKGATNAMQPTEQQPDVAKLVEALEYLMEKYPASRHLQDTCSAALAAYHKGEES